MVSRVVVSTVGTTGDVVPYLALAEGLRRRGHEPTLVSHEFHRERVRARRIAFEAESDVCSLEDFNAALARLSNEAKPLSQFEGLLFELFLRRAEPRFERLVEIVSDADLVIANGFDFLGQEAAIRVGVPWVSVSVLPQLIPTLEAPVFPLPRLGTWWTRQTWKGLHAQARDMNRRTQRVLARLGAAPRDLGVAGAISEHLHLVPVSGDLSPRRGDWPSHIVTTGAWRLADAPPHLDRALFHFLEQHPEPVVVSFGSMGGGAAAGTASLLADTLRRLQRPAVVQRGYAGLSVSGVPDVLEVGYVPHDLLFRRAACVVHHCGAGTSFAACHAGVPSVAVPHLFDQFYWASMLAQRGLAPKPLPRSRLTARGLAARIREACRPEFRSRARALSERLARESGVDAAIDAVEGLLERLG